MADLKIKWTDLIAEPTTVLTNPAVGDYVLIYDASEPLDTKKIKVISYQNLVNLAAQSAVQSLVASQASGDLFYANGATSIARLAKGAAGQSLRVDSGANAPEWGSPLSGYGSFNVYTISSLTSTSWADITGATVDVNLSGISTLIAFAAFELIKDSSGSGWFRWMLDGTAQYESKFEYHVGAISHPGAVIGSKINVAAGTRTCKLQYYVSANSITFQRINGIVIAFPQ